MLKYGDLDLQSQYILTETVQFRSMADRVVSLAAVSRRPGSKFLGDEYGTKTVQMTGRVIAPSASGLVGILDEMHRQLSLPDQDLIVTDGRVITATCTRADFPEQRYNQSSVSFSLDFISATPFSSGTPQNSTFIIPSGTAIQQISTTISGSVFAEPIIRLSTVGAGDSGWEDVSIFHDTAGETVTFSGALDIGVESVVNYEDATVTVSGLLSDYVGSFSRWDVGPNTFTVTLSGVNDYDVTGTLEYSPRYFF